MATQVRVWNEGETAMREQLNVPFMTNPTSYGFPSRYNVRLQQSSLLAVGAVDSQGCPWTTIWGGERGFAKMVADDMIGIQSSVATARDPVFEALFGRAGDGEVGEVVVQPDEEKDRQMAGLLMDVETRDRIKLSGRMVGGVVVDKATVQMAVHVASSTGNCPKYINRRDIVPHPVVPEKVELAHAGLPLPDEALDLIAKADLFFLSSTNGQDMSTNHRGGPPGFVRVASNDKTAVDIVYPEYSGNRFYSTLGNLKVNPKVGIVIPDFDTGNALYLTGSTSILVGQEASAVLPRTPLAVRIRVTDARLVRAGLPFRGSFVDHSPYNPPIRYLSTERAPPNAAPSSGSSISASLVRREIITPTIARFTFKLSSKQTWLPGQHVTFDFSSHLSNGYRHMAENDPQSLNDDYIRTFTVSSRPEDKEMQITVRKHGPATGFLWTHDHLDGSQAVDIPVTGFGGKDSFRLPTSVIKDAASPVFVAGGVGITPLLAQASPLLRTRSSRLRLLWSLRAEDAALAVDSFERIPGLAGATTLFITGIKTEDLASLDKKHPVREAAALGARVEGRRILPEDLEPFKTKQSKFFLCAGPALLQKLNSWLDGTDVVWEDFGY